MASQLSRRTAARRGSSDAERSTWLSHGLAAVGISALGLAVAGSVSLTSNAQAPETGSARPVTVMPADVQPTMPAGSSKVADAFARPTTEPEKTRSVAVRKAIVTERAAQRAEILAERAEAAAADQAAASKARQDKLTKASQASQETAAKLVQESIRRAAAARAAAETNRRIAEAGDTGAASTTSIPTDGTGSAPVPGAVIGARFGQYGLWSRYHTGIDFRAAYGTPIRAVLPGVVLFAGNSGDWAGNHVAVSHSDGTTTMYSHMSSMSAQVGQSVLAGQVIGYVGQSGRAFGAHLHFELYPAGAKYGDVYKAIDPLPWLRSHGIITR